MRGRVQGVREAAGQVRVDLRAQVDAYVLQPHRRVRFVATY